MSYTNGPKIHNNSRSHSDEVDRSFPETVKSTLKVVNQCVSDNYFTVSEGGTCLMKHS